jgi:hypothetical protein
MADGLNKYRRLFRKPLFQLIFLIIYHTIKTKLTFYRFKYIKKSGQVGRIAYPVFKIKRQRQGHKRNFVALSSLGRSLIPAIGVTRVIIPKATGNQ